MAHLVQLATAPAPEQPLDHLDQLWFQVAGTHCNLECAHCFISCGPHNRRFGYLTLDEVRRRLDESVPLGVKEYYFTGGEPFLNPDLVPMLIATLSYGPATVLTNGTVLKDEWLERLSAAEATGPYSLEFRVSLDGPTPETNDPLRGDGTFPRILKGIEKLVAHGFLPIITVVRTWPAADEPNIFTRFVRLLRERDYHRPRIKILPSLQLGAETLRTCGYAADQRVTAEMLDGFDRRQLLCHHARIVTDRGVHVCPLMIEAPDSLLGESLAESRRPYRLGHGACWTCFQYGAICANPSAAPHEL